MEQTSCTAQLQPDMNRPEAAAPPPPKSGGDVRDDLFAPLHGMRFGGEIRVQGDGTFCGRREAEIIAGQIGLEAIFHYEDGMVVNSGDAVVSFSGSAKQISVAEESLIGCMAKYSGIASAAARAAALACGRVEIVCGAWKKMPLAIKEPVRAAIAAGGAHYRITAPPMMYFDKNFLRMFGSITAALNETRRFPLHTPVVQLRGGGCLLSIERQTQEAALGGAKVLMIDTGNPGDIALCLETLERLDMRKTVKVAFAGGVTLKDVARLSVSGIDILCLGRAIVDAPLMDMSLDIHPPNHKDLGGRDETCLAAESIYKEKPECH